MSIFVAVIFGIFSFFSVTVREGDYKFPEIKHFPKFPKYKTSVKEVELGRFLFYDPVLSKDSTIACSTCHRQEFAFSYAPGYQRNESSLRERRNIMPLFNLNWSARFFWDGRAKSLEDQIYFPVRDPNEMKSDWHSVEKRLNQNSFYKKKFFETYKVNSIDSVHISKAIAGFLKTLLSYNSKFDKVKRNEAKFTNEELEGYLIMLDTKKGNCFKCHSTEVTNFGFSRAFSNNGLQMNFNEATIDKGLGGITKREKDIGKFKIPSLRNLGYTAPYMHDGRFKYLDFLINFYSDGVKMSKTIDNRMTLAHQGGARFNSIEKRKVIAFLSTLNDSVFVNNKEFSNPFLTIK